MAQATHQQRLLPNRAALAVASGFALAFIVRLWVVFAVPWRAWFDDDWYLRAALDLAAGNGYLNEHGLPTAFFPVGYPLTLAAVLAVAGGGLRTAQLLNVAFSVGAIACVWLLARRFGLPRRTAGLAAAMFGLMPSQVVSCLVSMSEIPFTFALMLGILLTVHQPYRPVWQVLGGMVFGWATLIRPQAVFVPFIVVIVVGFIRERLKPWHPALLRRLLVVALALGAVVGPWTYRNYRLFDAFVLVSTNGGVNLLIGNNSIAEGKYFMPTEVYPKELGVEQLSELEVDRVSRTLARAYMAEHPWETLLRVPKKVWYMYRSDLGVSNWVWEFNGHAGTALYYLCQGLTQGAYLAVLLGGLFWMARMSLRQRASATSSSASGALALRLVWAVSLSLIGYFTLMSMVFFGDARYHQPVMPLFALAAACAFQRAREPDAAAPAE